MPVDNVAALEMDEKVLADWKTVYKNCKKQRSIMKKDAYDDFISEIKTNYKIRLKNELAKNGDTVDLEIFESFFKYVIERSEEYMGIVGTNKESKFYRKERGKAVMDLIVASRRVLNVLKKTREANGENDAEFLKKYKISIKKPIKSNAKIQDCIYSYVMDLYGVRLYLVFTLNKLAEGEFDFVEYEMDGKKVVDLNAKSRNIYLVTEKNVNVDVPLFGNVITLKASVYVSPNSGALDATADFLVKRKWLNVDGKALTKVVLD